MIDKQAIRSFVYALAVADDTDGPSLVVRVKYRGDSSVYDEGAPWGVEKIDENGLKDPGFGSGPVLFASIECLSVPRLPLRQTNVPAYIKKFDALVALCSGMERVLVTPEAVTLAPKRG